MAMVGVDSGSLYRRTHSLSRLHGLVLGRRPLGDVLHSSNKSGKFLQWLCHDDSTINIVLELLLFTIIIIIVKIKKTSLLFLWNARYTGLKVETPVSADDKPTAVEVALLKEWRRRYENISVQITIKYTDKKEKEQELSYRQQIARQLCTEYAEGI